MINDALLSFKSVEMNVILKDANLLAVTRNLTICAGSGMNTALDYYQTLVNDRKINAQGVYTYYDGVAIGWALVTRENDRLYFYPREGYACIQIYVEPKFRRNGIGAGLLKTATQMSNDIFNVYSWDNPAFFAAFLEEKNFKSL